MKAIEYKKYGPPDVLQSKEIDKPVANINEVLIKVAVTTVSATDSIFRNGKRFSARSFTGFTKPKYNIPGDAFAGVIEETGKDVKLFSKGDKIFGSTGTGFGACAEYICLNENLPISILPTGMNFGDAAAVCDGALTALHFLRDKLKIGAGQKILIIGASGSIGTYAVQIAKYYSADVTGVCGNRNVDLVKSLGADKVIDYSAQDYSQINETFDFVFDTVGKSSFSKSKKLLTLNGIYITSVISSSILFQMIRTSMIGNKKAMIAFAGMRSPKEKLEDLSSLKKIIEEGKLKSIIDRTYTLEQIKDAHRYVDSGHKKGVVIVQITDAEKS